VFDLHLWRYEGLWKNEKAHIFTADAANFVCFLSLYCEKIHFTLDELDL